MLSEDFDSFLEAELPRLLGLALALSGNQHDAWDLTQESLIRTGARWARVTSNGDPAAYARTVLVRLNIDRLRGLRRERLIERVPDRVADAAVPHSSEWDPWIAPAMAALTKRQRTAVVLRYVEDLDHAAIAARMGCSPGTARSHLSRGLEALRRQAPDRQQAGKEAQ